MMPGYSSFLNEALIDFLPQFYGFINLASNSNERS